MRASVLLLMAWLLPGCQCDPSPQPAALAPSASAIPSAELTTQPLGRPLAARPTPPIPKSGLTPLAGPAQVTLSLEAGSRVVQVPVGTRRAQPLLIVLGGGAEHCAPWRELIQTAFVLCLDAGKPDPSVKLTESGGQAGTDASANPAAELTNRLEASLRAQVKQAVRQLEERFGDHLGPRGALVGHGAGAVAAANLMRETPALFPRGVLVDGGAEVFSAAVARAFATGGGESVLLVCSDCPAEKAVTVLSKEGVAAWRAPAFQVNSAADWLTRGDPWWLGDPPSLDSLP
ncbi:MAG: hypothetical protein KIT72_17320 [Polyangiaceae bacterium]|nr:hypothetical protein [Polyangiaceae bacterium]MCW5792175.1 hypothetical protein [Polyangiaceae bacterium]